jgi:predicted DNA-binding transcriptional regulator YafY
MSFGKAVTLLRLAELAASRHLGVALAEIAEEFGCDHRTAQRMTRALEECFPSVQVRTDEQRRKLWSLRGSDARLILSQGIRDSELVALEMCIRRAERDDLANDAEVLRSLRNRLLATMPRPHALRAEVDAEALLEAYGFACRPGPRVKVQRFILSVVAEALKGPFQLRVTYSAADGTGTERVLEPYGLLMGTRRYLVAKEVGGSNRLKHFRLDRILHAWLEGTTFRRDPDFTLDAHAARAFGSFHAEDEFGEVIWRFSPSAARVAREFLFHPTQVVTEAEDGSVTVRFEASGHLEMAWHLYSWGDSVEVVAPDRLRKLVEQYRRKDFPALP